MSSSLGFQAGFRVVREALGVSVKAAADRLRVTTTTVNRFERGERSMYLHQAATLAQLYDVPLDMLIREPTVDDLLVLRDKWIESQKPAPPPAPAPELPDWPMMNRGQPGERPYTLDEMKRLGHDPGAYKAPQVQHRPGHQLEIDPALKAALVDWDEG